MPQHQSPDDLSDRRAVVETLAALWDAAGAGSSFCAPGCSCGAGMLFALGAGDIEADVIAFLQGRFPADREPALARLLESRALGSAWGGPPFGAWLRSLAEAPLERSAFDALAASLATVLDSLGDGPSGPASRFACT